MATTYNSQFYDSSGNLLAGYPRTTPFGSRVVDYTVTFATTDLQDDDVKFIMPIPSGRKVVMWSAEWGDGDSGTALDLDIILRRTLDGTTTDVTLFNAGAAFQSAQATQRVFYGATTAGRADNDLCHIIGKVNTSAGTAVEFTLKGAVWLE